MTTNTEIMTRPAAHTWWWYGLLLLATIGILTIYQDVLDVYEVSILIFTAISMGLVGNHWPGFRAHAVAVAILSLIALQLYGTDLGAAETNGLLKYMLASQSAIMWMSVFFIAATFTYFGGLIFRSDYTEKVGSAFTWIATTFGMTGLMVRWRETHMMGADIGYIPVSNLYEVFILFAVVTALIYLSTNVAIKCGVWAALFYWLFQRLLSFNFGMHLNVTRMKSNPWFLHYKATG